VKENKLFFSNHGFEFSPLPLESPLPLNDQKKLLITLGKAIKIADELRIKAIAGEAATANLSKYR
jgi:hypothetical protein